MVKGSFARNPSCMLLPSFHHASYISVSQCLLLMLTPLNTHLLGFSVSASQNEGRPIYTSALLPLLLCWNGNCVFNTSWNGWSVGTRNASPSFFFFFFLCLWPNVVTPASSVLTQKSKHKPLSILRSGL